MSRRKIVIPEKTIERSILEFLHVSGVFCWKNETMGTFDSKRGVYRRSNNPHKIAGVSDILGIYKGKFLAIEVKSDIGRLSENQKSFIEKANAQGGIAFVARSIDDVAEKLGIRI